MLVIKIINKLSIVLVLFVLAVSHIVFAEKVQLKISEKITSNAEFYSGDTDKPAIMILHGFLLNHNFHTVSRLAESLNESGYTVLTPTLSLGVNKRKQGLPCEAIHLHSLETDIKEIEKWAKWLEGKVANEIVILGHSSGSIHLINYLNASASNKNKVKQIILLAIPHFGVLTSYSFETPENAQAAREQVAKGSKAIAEYGLSYCKKYITTATNYLSYYNLNKQYIEEELDNLQVNKTIIYGTDDKFIDLQWIKSLANKNVKIIPIEGANHFFDYEYEFSLLNVVEDILSTKS
ncbi:MAG: DUF1749 domain-containing protein [Pseudomonadota bacterium]